MKDFNPFLERYKNQSVILNPGNRDVMAEIPIEGSVDSLESYIMRIEGGENGSGKYWRPQSSQWITAELPTLKTQLREINQRIDTWRKGQMNLGNSPNGKIPEHLQERRQMVEAQISINEMELDWLKSRLDKASKRSD